MRRRLLLVCFNACSVALAILLSSALNTSFSRLVSYTTKNKSLITHTFRQTRSFQFVASRLTFNVRCIPKEYN